MGSTVELAWVVGIVGELALPLVCCAVALMREISSPSFYSQCQWQVGEFALKGVMRALRVGPASYLLQRLREWTCTSLDSIVDLVLNVGFAGEPALSA
jgi:hypothetical protein